MGISRPKDTVFRLRAYTGSGDEERERRAKTIIRKYIKVCKTWVDFSSL